MKKIICVLVTLLLLWILFESFIRIQSQISKPHTVPTVTETPFVPLSSDRLWTLINEYRVEKGLSPFIKDQRLCKISDSRVVDILEDYSHDKLYSDDKYTRDYAYSENIDISWTEEESVRDWSDSPSHRKALEGSWIYSCISTKQKSTVQIFSSFDSYNHNAL